MLVCMGDISLDRTERQFRAGVYAPLSETYGRRPQLGSDLAEVTLLLLRPHTDHEEATTKVGEARNVLRQFPLALRGAKHVRHALEAMRLREPRPRRSLPPS
jgi:hypothetical protein